MKKYKYIILITIVLVLITGCSNETTEKKELEKEKRTMNYLMKNYVKANYKANIKSLKEIFPKYYIEYPEEIKTQDYLDNIVKENKEKYGDDYKLSFEILREQKLSEEELNDLNNRIKEKYNTEEEAKECYKYQGTIVYEGIKYDEVLSLGILKRCQYNNKWYLVKE